jgi:hypothetical protein
MSFATVIAPVLPQLVSVGGVVIAGLGGVVLTQRYNDRQRARERATAANTKVEELTRELFAAVSELHLALSAYQPVHNTWRSRLMVLGSAFLEFVAAKERDGLPQGMVQVARIVTEAEQREVLAAQALRVPLQRVMSATARAALLPDGAVRDAAIRLSEAAADAGPAYGLDNLLHRKKATAARQQSDEALFAALRDLIDAVSAVLHAQEQPRRSWTARLVRRRRRAELTDAAVLNATVPAPRDGEHDTGAAPGVAAC